MNVPREGSPSAKRRPFIALSKLLVSPTAG